MDYILRPFLSPLREIKRQKTRLSGYGVELQIKSTEYKAQDDRKVVDGGKSDGDSESGSDDDAKADEIDGFNFDVLKEKHPEDEEKLTEFR